MSIIEQNVTVTMCRENLADVPVYPVPAGYSVRAFCPGDEHNWVVIQSASDRFNRITPELFRAEFGDDSGVLAERQFFLLDPQDKAIGTATAWFDDNFLGRRYGRVHWVAIHPGRQGRGLSKPLMSKVCGVLRELGHGRAYLVTSTARIPAINLYLHFGFVPLVRSAGDESAWAAVNRQLAGRREGG